MSTYPPALPPTSVYATTTSNPQSVVITDINMSIGAMCRFMVKWVIAAIPAAIILWLFLLAVGAIVALIFGGLIHSLMGPGQLHL